jgi:S-adenosylmethionine decarboxylase proenzyme
MMFGDVQNFCRTIAKRSQLREGSKGVERVIMEMYRYQDKKISNKELSRMVQIPVPVLSAVRSELLNEGFLKTKSIFSSKALKWIRGEMGLSYTIDFLQEFISTSFLEVSEKYLDFFAPVLDYLSQRPPPEYKYDQSRSTSETVLKRALLMLKYGDVEGKRITILGDDDGVSMALAYLKCAREIFVLDVDSRVLEVITSFADEYSFNDILKTQFWDLRTSFPKEWLGRYNTFETDPPYTVAGFKVFVDQAINFLDPDEGGRGYISFGNKSPHETWTCQQHLLESGFAINTFFTDFNQYHGATILGNTSNLYVVSTVPQKVRLLETKHPETAIYTFNDKKSEDLPTVGYQIIAEFYGVKEEYLTNSKLLEDVLKSGIKNSELSMEDLYVKEYSPYGLSLVAILVESHCHLHTWPEHNYLSIDLFVCDEKEKAEKLFLYLLNEINPLDYHRFQFFRGKSPISS